MTSKTYVGLRTSLNNKSENEKRILIKFKRECYKHVYISGLCCCETQDTTASNRSSVIGAKKCHHKEWLKSLCLSCNTEI